MVDNNTIEEVLMVNTKRCDKLNLLLLNTNRYDPDKVLPNCSSFVAEYILENKNLSIDTIERSTHSAVSTKNINLFDLLSKHPSFYTLNAYQMIYLSHANIVKYVIDTMVTLDNYDDTLMNIVLTYNNDRLFTNINIRIISICEILLQSKFLASDESLHTCLLHAIKNIPDQKHIILILSKIINPDKDVLQQCLIIACEHNYYNVIDKLLDYNIDTDNAFKISLNSNNLISAAMISNYDISEHLEDEYINTCTEKYIDLLQEIFRNNTRHFLKFIIKKAILNVVKDQDDLAHVIKKYGTYITIDELLLHLKIKTLDILKI